jgi:hypothetical protein
MLKPCIDYVCNSVIDLNSHVAKIVEKTMFPCNLVSRDTSDNVEIL